MRKEQIEQLINAIKYESNLNAIFWDRVAYWWFWTDLDDIWLVITPIFETEDACYSIEMVQFQIIDGKTPNTRLKLKWYMDKVEDFLNSQLKDFEWFKTLAVKDTWEETVLQDNKSRYVFTKRFNFMYAK